jgi:hypothetical protein
MFGHASMQYASGKRETPGRSRERRVIAKPCSRCDELLCDYGKARIRFDQLRETQQGERDLAFAYLKDYLRVQEECARLRSRVIIHLRNHDLDA